MLDRHALAADTSHRAIRRRRCRGLPLHFHEQIEQQRLAAIDVEHRVLRKLLDGLPTAWRRRNPLRDRRARSRLGNGRTPPHIGPLCRRCAGLAATVRPGAHRRARPAQRACTPRRAQRQMSTTSRRRNVWTAWEPPCHWCAAAHGRETIAVHRLRRPRSTRGGASRGARTVFDKHRARPPAGRRAVFDALPVDKRGDGQQTKRPQQGGDGRRSLPFKGRAGWGWAANEEIPPLQGEGRVGMGMGLEPRARPVPRLPSEGEERLRRQPGGSSSYSPGTDVDRCARPGPQLARAASSPGPARPALNHERS